MQVPVDLDSLLAGGWPAEPAAQQQLARTLFQHVVKLCHSGSAPQLNTWLQQLPPSVRNGEPLIIYVEAACLSFVGDHEAAQQLVSELWAAVHAGRHPAGALRDPDNAWPDRFAAAVAVLAVHCAVMTAQYAQALKITADSKDICSFAPDQQARLLSYAFTAEYFLGHYEQALELGAQLLALPDVEPYTYIQASAYLAAMHADLGRFAEAHTLLRRAEATLARFPYVGLQCLVLAVHAHVRIVQDDPIAALRLTERALPLATDAEQAHARVMLLLVHARALGLLGRWGDVAAALSELNDSKMARWNQCRLETAWALHDASTGNRDLALQRIPSIFAALSQEAPPGETWTLLELAEAADIAGYPSLGELLDYLHKLVPPIHIAGRARLAWLTAKHAWRSGAAYTDLLGRFVAQCQRHQLTGILGRAAREAPHIFLGGLQAGIASPLYAAALPALSDEQMQHLAAVVTAPEHPAPVRQIAWHCLARHPEHEATLHAAAALAETDASGLGAAAQRLLQSVPHERHGPQPADLQFRTFGEFELTYRGRQSHVPWRRKAQILFTLLMIQHPRPLPRHTVQELLWPDHTPEAAGNNLRVVIHSLRRTLAGLFDGEADSARGSAQAVQAAKAAPAAPATQSAQAVLEVVSTGDALSLRGAEAVQWDARDFAAYVATARQCLAVGDPTGATGAYSHAVALYRGPFLADRWFDKAFALDREHYAILAHEASLELAALHLDHGDPLQALVLAEQAIETDPLDEIAHQLVIRAQAALGYPHRAAAAFARFQALAAETGTTLDGSTERLVQQLLQGNGTSATANGGH